MLINGDSLEYIKTLQDNSIDCIITDPPYLYLKHKLDKQFNEELFFSECYRVLKKDSYLVFFGRGVALSKWNIICDNLGFKFKEELIWDKGRPSNPLNPLSRKHELISLFAKGNPILNRVYINKIEYDKLAGDHHRIEIDLKRIISKVKNIKTYDDFKEWIKGDYIGENKRKHNITISSKIKQKDSAFSIYQSYTRGALLSSILRVNREHWQLQHPTQKPIELMQHLINLTTNANDTILDPFMGGGSTGVACVNLDRNFIGIEIDEEYFKIAKNRIDEAIKNKESSLFDKRVKCS